MNPTRNIGLKPLSFCEYNYPPGGWGGSPSGLSGISLILVRIIRQKRFWAKRPKGLSGRSAAGENLHDLGSERLIFLYEIAFRTPTDHFFSPAAGYVLIHAVKQCFVLTENYSAPDNPEEILFVQILLLRAHYR